MKKDANKGFRDMRTQSAAEPPKITFPCDYPLKVVGDAAEDFAASVCQILVKYDPDFDASAMQVVDSRNGRFQSVRVSIKATGEPQLAALFEELKATGRVHMVV
ncbi:YbeD family protein [Halomonas sp. HNIBRBA4712]|uniref:HP0495 family protein n=1 Tax=Halomonas sp. HNIBRBA4712 TaxID=3373087 RepID=UPI00374544DB